MSKHKLMTTLLFSLLVACVTVAAVTSIGFSAKARDLSPTDLAEHLRVKWNSFTFSLNKPPKEVCVRVLVAKEGNISAVFPSIDDATEQAKALNHDVAFLFQLSPEKNEMFYTLCLDRRFSVYGRMKNPFDKLSMVTVNTPNFDDKGRTVVAFALPPGETGITNAAQHPDTDYRAIILQIKTKP
jgi:hypothetical protein